MDAKREVLEKRVARFRVSSELLWRVHYVLSGGKRVFAGRMAGRDFRRAVVLDTDF
jgi:hypothetical protein